VAKRHGVEGSGLLLFAALVYAPLIGFYTFLRLFEFEDYAQGSTKVWLYLVLVIGAYIAITFLDTFLFSEERERSLGWRVPRILREGTRWSMLAVFALVTGAAIFHFEMNSLAIFGGGLTIALSLALGPTLGSLVSGFTLTAERPFELGDWIEVEGRQGRVDQITWRSTRIITRDNESVVFPNSLLSNIKLVNLSRPDAQLGVRAYTRVHFRTPPHEVIAAIEEAVRGTPGVVASPAQVIRMVEYAESWARWEVRFWIDDPRRIEDIRGDVLQRIWYSFQRHEIEIPGPVRNVVRREPEWDGPRPEPPEETRSRVRASIELLRRVPVFGPLPAPALERLAASAPIEVFLPGAHITEQGVPGDRMYIIIQGQVMVRVRIEGEGSRELSTLGPGQFFGEMSLLTGSPRVATVEALETVRALCLRSRDVAPLLREIPGFAQSMADFAAERKITLDETTRLIREDHSRGDLRETSSHLLRDIMRFFHLQPGRGDHHP
jgi:small-conductance mechanosensitive channel/CRP-like cAMP-binding protein